MHHWLRECNTFLFLCSQGSLLEGHQEPCHGGQRSIGKPNCVNSSFFHQELPNLFYEAILEHTVLLFLLTFLTVPFKSLRSKIKKTDPGFSVHWRIQSQNNSVQMLLVSSKIPHKYLDFRLVATLSY